jgi:alkanesulfonate monooxygenase SsuD/methylene tetrahydromethanopterin reductase-like flavin-dependent oxidoreductase (luciferase family)
VAAASSTGTAELAARRGLPMLLGMHADDEGKRAMVAHYERYGAGAGHLAAGVAYVADTRGEAQRVLRAAMPRWLGPGLAGYVPVDDRPRRPRDPEEYAALLCRIHPVGTAEDCVATLSETAERTGIGHFALLVEGAEDPALTRENIRRLGTEVLPSLRG